MILVIPASGYTGLTVIQALVNRGQQVRGLISNPQAEARVLAAGAAQVAHGDVRDLRALESAMTGVDGVFFLGSRHMAEEAAVGKAVIDLAVAASVSRFVLSGVYHPTIRPLFNHQSKRDMEDHLYKTDLEFVVLQPARFMHPLISANWDRVANQGVLADSFATDVEMAYVDYRDVADVAAEAFAGDRLVRGSFELASLGQFTLTELAALLSDELGREIRAQQVPWDEIPPARRGLDSPFSAEAFRRLWSYYNQYGFHGGNSLVLSSILGREPYSFVDCWKAEAASRTPSDSVS
jgi:uncharacterized protein YbjT (DUF2867 family)